MNLKVFKYSLIFILIFGSSCSEEDNPTVDNDPLVDSSPQIFILSELKTSDGAGIENVYKYTFDNDEKLIQISQNNPLNTPDQANVYDLIYDSTDNLTSITLKIGGSLINTFPVTKDANKVSLIGFGANNLNFYFDENSLITKKERVFDSNETAVNYNYNNIDQLQEIIFPAMSPSIPPGIADTFTNYDSEIPIIFFSEITNPVEDFIALYVFDLKYSLNGKPRSNKDGIINYTYNDTILSKITFGSGSSITFDYIEINN